MQKIFPSVSLVQLGDVASSLVKLLPKPLAIGLVGTLGAGKTTLVQAIASAAAVETDQVTSPTFTLLQTYHGPSLQLHHIDAYRLTDDDEFYELGVNELFDDQEAWVIVEWADRFDQCMPIETVWIQLELTGQVDRRRITISSQHPTVKAQLQRLDI